MQCLFKFEICDVGICSSVSVKVYTMLIMYTEVDPVLPGRVCEGLF